jgi:hypothetical protein
VAAAARIKAEPLILTRSALASLHSAAASGFTLAPAFPHGVIGRYRHCKQDRSTNHERILMNFDDAEKKTASSGAETY